jgi:hypothetical protein
VADPDIQSQIMEVLADPMNLPDTFWGYMIQRWLADAPVFPISQVFGFAQFTASPATDVLTQEATTSGTFGDLTTTGPTLTGLPDGKYVIRFGAAAFTTVTGTGALVGVSVNGGSITSGEYAEHGATSATSVVREVVKSLSNNGNNTLTLKYASGVGGTSVSFRNRWLVALRYGNL